MMNSLEIKNNILDAGGKLKTAELPSFGRARTAAIKTIKIHKILIF